MHYWTNVSCTLGNMYKSKFKGCAKSLNLNRIVIANIWILIQVCPKHCPKCSCINKFDPNQKSCEVRTIITHL